MNGRPSCFALQLRFTVAFPALTVLGRYQKELLCV